MMELKPITSYKSNEDFLELSHQIEHTIKLEPNCLAILSQFNSQTSQSENFFTERYSAQPYAMWNGPKTTFSDLPPGLNIETGGSSFTRGKTIEPEHEQQVEEDNNWTLLLENAITTRFGRKNDVNERNTSRFQRLFQTSADHTRLKLTSNSFMPVGTSLSKELHETEEIKKQVQEGTPCSMEVLQLIEQQVLEKKETDIISETPAENNENKDQILEETSLSKEPHQPTEYKILSKKEIEARKKMKEAELAKTSPQQPQKLNERKEEQVEEKNIKNKKHEDKFQRKGSSHLEKGLSKKELKSDPKEKDKTPKIQSISQGSGNVENKRKSFSIQGKTGGETPKKSNQEKTNNEEIPDKNVSAIRIRNPYDKLTSFSTIRSRSSSPESEDPKGSNEQDIDVKHIDEPKLSHKSADREKSEVKEGKEAENLEIRDSKIEKPNYVKIKTKKKPKNKKVEKVKKEEDSNIILSLEEEKQHEERKNEEKEEVKVGKQEEQIQSEKVQQKNHEENKDDQNKSTESLEDEKLTLTRVIEKDDKAKSKTAKNKKKKAKKKNKKANTLEDLDEKPTSEHENQDIGLGLNLPNTNQQLFIFPSRDFYDILIKNMTIVS